MAGEALQSLGKSLGGGQFLSTLGQFRALEDDNNKREAYQNSLDGLTSQFGEHQDFKRISQRYQTSIPGNVEGIANASEHMHNLQQLDQAFVGLVGRYEQGDNGLTDDEQAEFLSARKNLDVNRMNKYLDRHISRFDAVLGPIQEQQKIAAEEAKETSESQPGLNNFFRLSAGGEEGQESAIALGAQMLADPKFNATPQFIQTYQKLNPSASIDNVASSMVHFDRAIASGDFEGAREALNRYQAFALGDEDLAKRSGTMEATLEKSREKFAKTEVSSRLITSAVKKRISELKGTVDFSKIEDIGKTLTGEGSDLLKELKDLGFSTEESVMAIQKKAAEQVELHKKATQIKLENQERGGGADSSGMLSGGSDYTPDKAVTSLMTNSGLGFGEVHTIKDKTGRLRKMFINETGTKAIYVPSGSFEPMQLDLLEGKLVPGSERAVTFTGKGGLLSGTMLGNPNASAVSVEKDMATLASSFLGGVTLDNKLIAKQGKRLNKWGVSDVEFNELRPLIANYNYRLNQFRPTKTEVTWGVHGPIPISSRPHESDLEEMNAGRFIESALRLQLAIESLQKK
jgi:hypothetical protein